MKKIHKLMKKKNTYLDKNRNYEALTPTGDVKNGQEYFNALDWALKNDDIRNIAVSGPYGSGKSSVINSYFNHIKNKKVLKISLATFDLEAMNNKNDKETLETGILKQLFYSVRAEKIPHSRYRKLQAENSWKSVGHPLLATIVLYVVLYYFFYERTHVVLSSIVSLTGKYYVWYAIGIFGISWYFLCKLFEWLRRYGSIRELKIFDKATVVKDDVDSVFDKNMDEIVYFFESTKTKVVIFEDLDRFKSSKIFASLRELNYILNNYENIEKPVKFLYAIKDDMFVKKGERTKFFDFIIPIVPYISSTNSGEILRDKLQIDTEKNISDIYNISGDFISLISPYINDMRELICICNEFTVYKNTLQNNQDLSLNDEKMFALMVFKNLYPKDFAELENEESSSIIIKVFAAKDHFIETSSAGIKTKQRAEEKQISDIRQECIQSIKELKLCLLGSLTNYQSTVFHINDGSKQIYLSDYLSDSFDINSLKGHRLQVFYRNVNGDANTIIKDIEEYDKQHGKYYARMDRIKKDKSQSIEELSKAIEEQEQQIRGLRSYKIKQLIEEFGTGFIEESICKNDLLVFLLRNGYLDEDYENYINYFHPNSITKEEKNFILGIRNHRAIDSDYSYPLKHMEQIFNQLQDYEFRQKEIFNFDLVDYILTSKEHSLSVNMLMENLSDHSEESMNFIKAYIDRNEKMDVFMRCLCKSNKLFWRDVEWNEGISLATKYDYLVLMLKYVNMEDIIIQEKESGYDPGLLSQFMLSNTDSLKGIASAPCDKQIQLIRELDLVFYDVEIDTIDELVKLEIFDNWRYDLNEVMLCRMFEWKAPALVEMQKKKNYSSILQLENQELLDYVHECFEDYIEKIVLGMDDNREEDICAIEDIIERLMPDHLDLCIEVLKKECAIWDDIKKCCAKFKNEWKETKQKIWDYLLNNERIQCSFDNFVAYYNEFGATYAWETYLDNHMESMIDQIDDYNLSEDFVSDLLQADISMHSFRKLVTKIEIKPYAGELIGLGEEKVKILIEERVVPFATQCWEDMKSVAPKCRVKYAEAYKDEFIQALDELKCSENDINEMLTSSTFNDEEKSRLVMVLDAKDLGLQTAIAISSLKIRVEKKYSVAAWMVLDVERKKELLLYQMGNYNDAELSQLFLELPDEYRPLSERTNHTVKLEITDYNRMLLETLKERGYITSYREEIQKNGKGKEEIIYFSVKVKKSTGAVAGN